MSQVSQWVRDVHVLIVLESVIDCRRVGGRVLDSAGASVGSAGVLCRDFPKILWISPWSRACENPVFISCVSPRGIRDLGHLPPGVVLERPGEAVGEDN